MWTWETKNELKDFGQGELLPITTHTLINEDGVRISPVGVTREKADRLTYAGHGWSFDFLATRYDVDGNKVLDFYEVAPSPPLLFRRLIEQGKISEKDIETMIAVKQEIASALLLIRQLPDAENVPIQSVKFAKFFDIPKLPG